MNAHSKITDGTSTVFKLNRSQAVRIPKHLAFPEGVREVYVRRKGRGLEIVPVSDFWDDFFDRPGIDIEEPAELPYEAREPM